MGAKTVLKTKYSIVATVFSGVPMCFNILRSFKNQCFKVCMLNFKHIEQKPHNINPK